MIRSKTLALVLETLEAREVPAVVVDGTFTGSTADGSFKAVPNGGVVTINEIGGDAPFVAFGANGLNGVAVTKPATNTDIIALTLAGTTLTLTDSDGIFVKLQNGNLVNVGTSTDIANVTGLNVQLQLGGNDQITDATNLTATINAGPGNDTVTASGGTVDPLVMQLLLAPGGLNPALFPLLIGFPGQKVLQGDTGDDQLTGPLFGLLTQFDGGDGNDTIIGGLGIDIMTGGSGIDILVGFGGGDFYLASDAGPDLLLNQPRDVVLADPSDFKNPV